MPRRSPRHLLLLCAGLDLLGLITLLGLQLVVRQLPLAGQLGWIAAIVVGYLGLGWLFGTYSLLGWRRVPVAALRRGTLLPEPWLSYDAIPWNDALGVQRQLKRVADLLLAALLLLLTSPLLLLAALLIWLDDRGPVLYRQERSGWLGQPFSVLKLRTMAVAPADAPAIWTVPGDQRITRVGQWLRRSRLDELPQLLNVLRGEMSLIGPRPERPELERQLEASIRHYRKRHWMRPGLSGWAQVSAPYAASVEDSELKLSYDLYYLKHFSTWLDLVILLRTLKTVLKVAGQRQHLRRHRYAPASDYPGGEQTAAAGV